MLSFKTYQFLEINFTQQITFTLMLGRTLTVILTGTPSLGFTLKHVLTLMLVTYYSSITTIFCKII